MWDHGGQTLKYHNIIISLLSRYLVWACRDISFFMKARLMFWDQSANMKRNASGTYSLKLQSPAFINYFKSISHNKKYYDIWHASAPISQKLNSSNEATATFKSTMRSFLFCTTLYNAQAVSQDVPPSICFHLKLWWPTPFNSTAIFELRGLASFRVLISTFVTWRIPVDGA